MKKIILLLTLIMFFSFGAFFHSLNVNEEVEKNVTNGYYVNLNCEDTSYNYLNQYQTIENEYDNCLYTFSEYKPTKIEKKENYLKEIYKQNKDIKKNSIGYNVFMGDSIIYKYQNYFEMNENSINIGIPGITTYDLYKLLDFIYFSLPTEDINNVFILVGTNDGHMKDSIEGYTMSYSIEILNAIISRIKLNNNEINIYVIAPLLTNQEKAESLNKNTSEYIRKYNEELKLNLSEDAILIDINDYLVDDKGEIRAEYTVDGLHPNKEGYEIIVSAITTEIEKINTQV